MRKHTILVPIEVNYYRAEDEKPAKLLRDLMEYHLKRPEFNKRLEAIVDDVRREALSEVNRAYKNNELHLV